MTPEAPRPRDAPAKEAADGSSSETTAGAGRLEAGGSLRRAVRSGWATATRRTGRGFALARLSWRLFGDNRRLAAFPLAGGACMLGWAAGVGLPAAYLIQHGDRLIGGLLAAACFYGLSFLRTFFTTGLAVATTRAMAAEEISLGGGLRVALRRLRSVAGWSVVDLLGKLLSTALVVVGRLAFLGLGGLLGVAWSLLTLMAVPVIAQEGLGPLRTLRRSAGLLRGRWGEGISGEAWVTLVILACGGVPGAAGLGLGIGLVSLGRPFLGFILVAAGVAVLIVTAVAVAAVSQVFAVALYRYAAMGDTSGPFSAEVLDLAVAQRGRRSMPRPRRRSGDTPRGQ